MTTDAERTFLQSQPAERGSKVMARKKKAAEVDEVEEILDEIEEEELDDEEEYDDEEADDEEEYDDEADEEEEDDEEDLEEEEDPDTKPKKRSRSKGKSKSTKEGVGTNEVAEEAGISPRVLRQLLRAEFEKPEDGWRWSSMNHPTVKKILKRIREGAAKEQTSKRLEKVKGKAKGKKTTAKKTTKKKTTRRKK